MTFKSAAAHGVGRERLLNRRACETFDVEAGGLRYSATIGQYPDGRLAEVFLNAAKAGSAADVSARDAAVVFSIAVQSGADPETLRRALCRDESGRACGPLGVVLDDLAARGRSGVVEVDR